MTRTKKALRAIVGLGGFLFFAALFYSAHHVYTWVISQQDASSEFSQEKVIDNSKAEKISRPPKVVTAQREIVSQVDKPKFTNPLDELIDILERDDICLLKERWADLVDESTMAEALGRAPTKFVRPGLSHAAQLELFQMKSPLTGHRLEAPRSPEALFYNLLDSTGLTSEQGWHSSETEDEERLATEDLRKLMAIDSSNPLVYLISAYIKKKYGATEEEIKAEVLKSLELRGIFMDYRRELVRNIYERGRTNTSYFFLSKEMAQNPITVNYRKLMDAVVVPYVSVDDRSFSGQVLSMSWREVSRNIPKSEAKFSVFQHDLNEFDFFQSIYDLVDKQLWPRSTQDIAGINKWWKVKRVGVIKAKNQQLDGLDYPESKKMENSEGQCDRRAEDEYFSQAQKKLFGS